MLLESSSMNGRNENIFVMYEESGSIVAFFLLGNYSHITVLKVTPSVNVLCSDAVCPSRKIELPTFQWRECFVWHSIGFHLIWRISTENSVNLKPFYIWALEHPIIEASNIFSLTDAKVPGKQVYFLSMVICGLLIQRIQFIYTKSSCRCPFLPAENNIGTIWENCLRLLK